MVSMVMRKKYCVQTINLVRKGLLAERTGSTTE